MSKCVRPRSVCSVCCKFVTASSKAICCDICQRWTHVLCDSAVPDTLYEVLCKVPESPLLYPCPACRESNKVHALIEQSTVTQNAAIQTCLPSRALCTSKCGSVDIIPASNSPMNSSAVVSKNPGKQTATASLSATHYKSSKQRPTSPHPLTDKLSQAQSSNSRRPNKLTVSQKSVVLMNVPECHSEHLDVREQVENMF